MDFTRTLEAIAKVLSKTPIAKSSTLQHIYLQMIEQSLDENYTWTNYKQYKIWGQESEYVINQIRAEGVFEPEITETIESEIENGDTVIDVGSQWGVHLLTMSDAVGNEGHVYGFEPNPDHANAVRKTIQENEIGNIQLVEKGCGSENTTKDLAIRGDNSGASTFLKEKKTHSRTETVDVIRLDKFLSDFSVESVSLMKIDVEGFEQDVLTGLGEAIQSIQTILIELHHNLLDESQKQEIFTYLSEYGKCYNLDDEVLDWEEFNATNHIIWRNRK